MLYVDWKGGYCLFLKIYDRIFSKRTRIKALTAEKKANNIIR